MTQDGYYVVGKTAGAARRRPLLQVPAGATNVAIGQDGAVSYVPSTRRRRVSRGLPLAGHVPERGRPRAQRRQPLDRVRQLRRAEHAGTPGASGFGTTTAGAVEMSNVDLAQTFTSMITAQRGFQANSRVISTSDEMLQDLVNLKR